MKFGWLNILNALTVAYLTLVSFIAAKKGVSESFKSEKKLLNILELVGRLGSMLFMVVPLTPGLMFTFHSGAGMLLWFLMLGMVPTVYAVLWIMKPHTGDGTLYALAILPTALFLVNGFVLLHPALIVSAAIFGYAHITILRENLAKKKAQAIKGKKKK